MKAEELRIGNFVHQGMYGDLEITSLNIHNYYTLSQGGSVSDYYIDWKPIELDWPWLVRFGFGKSDEDELGHNLNKNFGFYYNYHFKTFLLDCDSGVNRASALIEMNNIKYVHQLQNLYFALTGEELKIQ